MPRPADRRYGLPFMAACRSNQIPPKTGLFQKLFRYQLYRMPSGVPNYRPSFLCNLGVKQTIQNIRGVAVGAFYGKTEKWCKIVRDEGIELQGKIIELRTPGLLQHASFHGPSLAVAAGCFSSPNPRRWCCRRRRLTCSTSLGFNLAVSNNCSWV